MGRTFERQKKLTQPQDIVYTFLRSYRPPELGKVLEQIVSGHWGMNLWEYFESTRCWWQGGPLKPISEPYVEELKAELRRRFGDPYEAVVQHFVPHFQRLAKDYS